MMSLRIAGVVGESITDGPGYRYTVFVQGCHRHCEGCHNPSTWDPAGGREADVAAMLSEIRGNPLLRGVTISGGEPFEQAGALLEFARSIKELGLELALYSGSVFEELAADTTSDRYALLSLADVLVDGEFIMARRNLGLRFMGSENQCVIDVPASLREGRAVESRDERWI